MKKKKSFLYSTLILFCLLSSCTTIPRDRSSFAWFGILPQGDSLYICFHEPGQFLSLFNEIETFTKLGIPDMEKILLKTESVFTSLKIREKMPPLFSIAAAGRYGSFCIGVGLNVSRQWVRDPGTGMYWKQKKTGMMIAKPDNYHLFAANRDMISFIETAGSPVDQILSPGLRDSLENKTCTLFFPSFGDEVIPESIPINKKKLPIQDVLISLDSESGKDTFFLHASFNLMQPDNAQLFTTTFKTFLIWLLRHAEINSFPRRVTVEVDGAFVHTVVPDFTQQELSRILRVLLSAEELQ
jgi:hypothetical protein